MMKPLLTLATLALSSAASAESVEITVPNVRNDKGTILVMANSAQAEAPVYGKADAKQGSVVITLDGLEADTVQISLFHDEDGDYQMKMGDRGPEEGFARHEYSLSAERTAIEIPLTYLGAGESR